MGRWFGVWAGVAVSTAAFSSVGQSAAAATAAAAPPGVIANFVTAGTPDPKGRVPALNAVPGAGVDNVTMAMPLGVLQHGHVYTVMVTSQNNTFEGFCTDSYTLRQGTTVLMSGKIKTFACQPGTYWAWVANSRPIPNKPGLATLTGTVTYGGKTTTTTSTVLIK